MTENELPPLGFWGRMGMKTMRAFSHLPMRVLYLFADFAYFVMYWVLSYRIKVVRENLRTAFPLKDAKELRSIERRFYRHLADYFFETIKGLTISDEELKERFVMRNPELVVDIVKNGKTVFLYGAHIGNWEWFTALPLYMKDTPINAFYQPQRNSFANHMTVAQRTRRGIVAVESQKGFRHIFKNLKEQHYSAVLVLGDQCPHRGAQKHWIDFMGKDTPFLVGPEHIARKLDIALVYPSYVAYERGHYEVEYRLIEMSPKNVGESVCTARFAAYLEDDLNRLPELWLWSHRRWKLEHEDFLSEENDNK